MTSTITGHLLIQFLQAQEERARGYATLSAAHRLYMENKAEGPYRFVMNDVTAIFQNVSERVRGIEAHLVQHGRDDLALLLRQVQEGEREKLEISLSLQALRTALAQGQFSWRTDDAAAAGGVGAPSNRCNHSERGHSTQEPSQKDMDEAISECIKTLESVVQQINDALEEIRSQCDE